MAVISSKNVARAIYASAKDKSGAELDRTLTSARDFLIKKNLLSKSSEILDYLQKFTDEDSGTVRAKILSPGKITEHASHELKTALKKRYKATDIVLDLKEDKSLIGGFRVEANDEVIDLSVKNKLTQLQAHLSHN
ncbi:MAG: F0F1 ATP synthase subunit delta [Patescibacteria group bacterium]